MKFPFILILLLCLPFMISLPLKADVIDETDSSAPTTDSMVNAYYNRCINEVFQDLAPETREEFCGCTAAQVKEVLRGSELETMATGRGKPVDPQTLAIKIMAPCMSAPVDELEYNSCMGDITYAHLFKTQDAYNATCHCVGAGISRFVADYGRDLMAMLVKVNPDTANIPADSLRAAPQYVQERNRLHNKCMNENAHQ